MGSGIENEGNGAQGGDVRWFVRSSSGSVYGPADRGALVSWSEAGRIMPDDEISADGERWFSADSVEELRLDTMVEYSDGNSMGPYNASALRSVFPHGSLPANVSVRRIEPARAKITFREICAGESGGQADERMPAGTDDHVSGENSQAVSEPSAVYDGEAAEPSDGGGFEGAAEECVLGDEIEGYVDDEGVDAQSARQEEPEAFPADDAEGLEPEPEDSAEPESLEFSPDKQDFSSYEPGVGPDDYHSSWSEADVPDAPSDAAADGVVRAAEHERREERDFRTDFERDSAARAELESRIRDLEMRLASSERECADLRCRLGNAIAEVKNASSVLSPDTAVLKSFADEAIAVLRKMLDFETERNSAARAASAGLQKNLREHIGQLERAMNREPGEPTQAEQYMKHVNRQIAQLQQELEAERKHHQADMARAESNEKALEQRCKILMQKESVALRRLEDEEKHCADYDSMVSLASRRGSALQNLEKEYEAAREQWKLMEASLLKRIDELEHGAGLLFDAKTKKDDADQAAAGAPVRPAAVRSRNSKSKSAPTFTLLKLEK